MESHAAFENAISEQPNLVFDGWIPPMDWTNIDLLDACYDLVPYGMGLGSPDDRADAGCATHLLAQDMPELDLQLHFTGDFEIAPIGSNSNTNGPSFNSSDDTTPEQPVVGDPNNWACDVCHTVCRNYWSLEHHGSESGHFPFKCVTCDFTYLYIWALESHGKTSRHAVYRCNFAGCSQGFTRWLERSAHQRIPHTSGHGRVATPTPFDCVECLESLKSKVHLLRHGKERQHQPYGCECGAMFSRLDVLNRHLKSFDTTTPKYPCRFCRNHRGENGFRRADHLQQHMRSYHHHETGNDNDSPGEYRRCQKQYVFPTCSHPDCPKFRGPEFFQLPRLAKESSKPFATQSEYTKHMREEHNECIYPCDIDGCPRVGRRGYFREKDLRNHRKEEHPDAPPYQVSKRELSFKCTEPGCNAILDQNSLNWHYTDVHRQS